MIRRATILLSLCTVAAGVLVLTRTRGQELACSYSASRIGSSPMSAICAKTVSSYLIGVTLTIGGLLILVLLVFAMVSHARRAGWDKKLPSIPRLREHAVGMTSR